MNLTRQEMTLLVDCVRMQIDSLQAHILYKDSYHPSDLPQLEKNLEVLKELDKKLTEEFT